MSGHPVSHARRTEVAPEDVGADYDYADAFEIDLADGDTRTPEQLFRAALRRARRTPPLIPLVHKHVLRFRLGPLASPDHLFGWRIVVSQPDIVRLEADGPLMRGVIIGRRVFPSTAVLTTYVVYLQRLRARIIWAFIGSLHRKVAPQLLESAAASSHSANNLSES